MLMNHVDKKLPFSPFLLLFQVIPESVYQQVLDEVGKGSAIHI